MNYNVIPKKLKKGCNEHLIFEDTNTLLCKPNNEIRRKDNYRFPSISDQQTLSVKDHSMFYDLC